MSLKGRHKSDSAVIFPCPGHKGKAKCGNRLATGMRKRSGLNADGASSSSSSIAIEPPRRQERQEEPRKTGRDVKKGVSVRVWEVSARVAHSTHLNPLLNLIGTLNPPAYSLAFDKVSDKARDKVGVATTRSPCSPRVPSVNSRLRNVRNRLHRKGGWGRLASIEL